MSDIANFIFTVANKLRGPYRPPQYRKVMLPLTVLRRLDCVLEPTKDAVLAEFARLTAKSMSEPAMRPVLARVADPTRKQAPLYNVSPFTFRKLLDDPENIAANLVNYIQSFSPKVREIFEMFKFEAEIDLLDKQDRLYLIVKEFANIDLHPSTLDNAHMGQLFEELVRRFNEQANEEAGDYFTPRDVIHLVADLAYTGDEELYRRGIARTIYDPTCGTGGMLSISEEHIKAQNPDAELTLFGQEYNEESYAICCSDLLIKDEPVDNIKFGNTLGTKKGGGDLLADQLFHYMLANPPFGVEWKPEKETVEDEYRKLGFSGRFGPGLPRISDGALLFLLHMLSKRHPGPDAGGPGSKIAVVFNGSPLFAGEPGSGESNTRRWIIENDWLDAVVALPDQLFYNTGIYTYIWLVSNRKPAERQGKVQLIDATGHYVKMKKSLGSKRNEIGDGTEGRPNQLAEITRLYAENKDGGTAMVDGKERVCSKIFDNREFGYLRLTVERPLRLNFQVNEERIAQLKEHNEFKKLATSKKKPGTHAHDDEVFHGQKHQEYLLSVLESFNNGRIFRNQADFEAQLDVVVGRMHADKKKKIKLDLSEKKVLVAGLSQRDPQADIIRGRNGIPVADAELRNTEQVPLPAALPAKLPFDYAKDADPNDLLHLVQPHCEAYFQREVIPHWPDAWVDYTKTKLGYEIPLSRHFYNYTPPRPLPAIEGDIKGLETEILELLREVV
ncbi:SAM-dependent DNA methyltransferase [Microvirga sp. STS02]|uniref:type I restriction-modification system subunit M n=1 Tax=Hymenobacter negativus TaxID=2795026 RepID=UPI0018DD195A|nr:MULTISPECIES: class I SAM-dependent DNA methyltransferase [Bacteria]MBH8567536.1 SAM-dependent DNA methyltransferase [Hymenobacter negativus]MBR7207268.1 SAM-dependent DNA methyltransferase [Microvirga sp. STS02]